MTLSYVMILVLSGVTILAASWLFRYRQVARPPLGTINLGDVLFMVTGIVLVPYLYLGLPGPLVGGLLALSALSALSVLGEAVLPRVAAWVMAIGLTGADIGLVVWDGAPARAFLLVNGVVIVLLVTAITNLWAQGGLRARDLAILAGAIAVYDLIATGFLPLTTELIARLDGMPFLPMLAWPVGGDRWVGIGLGDLLLAALGPLVLRKAYGRVAGAVAMVVAVMAIALTLGLVLWGVGPVTFPTMVVLGPLLIVQYGYWRHRRGGERTMTEYLRAEHVPYPNETNPSVSSVSSIWSTRRAVAG